MNLLRLYLCINEKSVVGNKLYLIAPPAVRDIILEPTLTKKFEQIDLLDKVVGIILDLMATILGSLKWLFSMTKKN